ncbi:uncharacterized protein [Hyperolius riggenbachi]|uniref:uncharacterized protein n=1 Tax=Hyperolius riggenbachi TaxID=752182 RepID=UPI0035A3B13D
MPESQTSSYKTKSKASRSTRSLAVSNAAVIARAEAEAAKARAAFADQEMQFKVQQAELEAKKVKQQAELENLYAQKEAAAANAKAKFLEAHEKCTSTPSLHLNHQDPLQRTSEYVHQHSRMIDTLQSTEDLQQDTINESHQAHFTIQPEVQNESPAHKPEDNIENELITDHLSTRQELQPAHGVSETPPFTPRRQEMSGTHSPSSITDTQTKDILRHALKEISEESLKSFKRKLCEQPGSEKIPWSKLEDKDAESVVDVIVRHYTIRQGPEMVVKVLKNINERQVSLELRNDLAEKVGIHIAEDGTSMYITNDPFHTPFRNHYQSDNGENDWSSPSITSLPHSTIKENTTPSTSYQPKHVREILPVETRKDEAAARGQKHPRGPRPDVPPKPPTAGDIHKKGGIGVAEAGTLMDITNDSLNTPFRNHYRRQSDNGENDWSSPSSGSGDFA